jgi:hypothetical protein
MARAARSAPQRGQVVRLWVTRAEVYSLGLKPCRRAKRPAAAARKRRSEVHRLVVEDRARSAAAEFPLLARQVRILGVL